MDVEATQTVFETVIERPTNDNFKIRRLVALALRRAGMPVTAANEVAFYAAIFLTLADDSAHSEARSTAMKRLNEYRFEATQRTAHDSRSFKYSTPNFAVLGHAENGVVTLHCIVTDADVGIVEGILGRYRGLQYGSFRCDPDEVRLANFLGRYRELVGHRP